ncbi:LysM peptidoglycan-binding domain-containing protein [Paenibacillus sp. BC26]|uniref:LysM peptidoglycan-binding domain-containing protein n=1 Tax=Paenibacillus sp. BC26 TaxID=1881032 RepID=UPI0008F3A44B|nr:LysM peptidoglycan-binding domain-containing protein [Paenibacillus sp. BC26]SFT09915.1 LysM domain-containing protein [Paenibacillus sp. BC26]
MNKESKRSDLQPRAARTKKKKSTLLMVQATAGILLISGILYSIYAAQSGSDPKQAATGNDPVGMQVIKTESSTKNDGDKVVHELAPAPGKSSGTTATAKPETSVKDDQETAVKPVVTPDKPSVSKPEIKVVQAGKPVSKPSSSTASKPAVKYPMTYVLKEGDTLSTISMKFYHSKQYVARLAEYNHIVFINDMVAGDVIKIPALSSSAGSSAAKPQNMDYSKVTLPATYLVRTGDTLSTISLQFYQTKKNVALIVKQNKLDPDKNLIAGSSLIIPAVPVVKPIANHTVKQGETLSSISRKHYGSTKYAVNIAQTNHLKNNDDIKAGDVLKIPYLKV